MRSCSSSTRTPWRLPNPFRYQSIGRGQPEVVEHRRMQQVRQIADRVQRAVGDGPRVLQRRRCRRRPPRSARCATASSTLIAVSTWPTSSCSSRAMLRRSSSCAVSSCDDSRWRSRAVSTSVSRCALDAPLEPAGIERGEQRDRDAGGERQADGLPDAALRRAVERAMSSCCCTNALRFRACTSSETRMTPSRFGMMRRRSRSRASAGQRRLSVDEHLEQRAAEIVDLAPQPRDALLLAGHVDDRDVALQRLVGGAIALFQLAAVLVGRGRIGIEQRVAHVDRAHQDLSAHGRQQVLGARVARVDVRSSAAPARPFGR